MSDVPCSHQKSTVLPNCSASLSKQRAHFYNRDSERCSLGGYHQRLPFAAVSFYFAYDRDRSTPALNILTWMAPSWRLAPVVDFPFPSPMTRASMWVQAFWISSNTLIHRCAPLVALDANLCLPCLVERCVEGSHLISRDQLCPII
jgi:hypothetical protein